MTNEQLLSEIGTLIDKKFDGIDKRFDGIDDRLDGIDNRLDGIDDRLNSMDTRLTNVELTQENKILPALNELTVTYSSTFKTFYEKAQKIDKMESDIEVLKQVTAEHSRILKKIS